VSTCQRTLQFQIAGAKVEFDWLRAKHAAIFYHIFFMIKMKSVDYQWITNEKKRAFSFIENTRLSLKIRFRLKTALFCYFSIG